MYVLGITGSLGSGKSTVAQMLRRKGALIVDADKVSHGFLAPGTSCFRRIVQCFGTAVLVKGRIDRRRLAKIVFYDPRSLKRLTAILHPEIAKMIRKMIRGYQKKYVRGVIGIDAPLLFEMGLEKICDAVVVVRATRAQQIERTHARSGLTHIEILKRMKAQMPIQKKIARADFVIDNQGNINQTRKQVEELWQRQVKTKR